MHSCLYSGHVRHTRFRPKHHQFCYRLTLAYLDLDEMEEVNSRFALLSRRRFSPMSLRTEDHFAGQSDWNSAIRCRVRELSGKDHEGPIRVLTPLRTFGIYFSPLCLYYLWNPNETLASVVAEVSNTPWYEKHWYFLGGDNRRESAISQSQPAHEFRLDKEFHVSPFMEMRQEYGWTLTDPADTLVTSIDNFDQDGKIFSASMNLERHEISNFSLVGMLMRFPVVPLQMLAAIYFEALRLWLKRLPYVPHPRTLTNTNLATTRSHATNRQLG